MVGSPSNSNLVLCTLILSTLGIIFIFSASSVPADQNYGDIFHFVKRQGLVLVIGTLSGYCIYRLPLVGLSRLILPLFCTAVVLLLCTHIPLFSKTVNGASRWIKWGVINFQPAELVKLAVILLVAKNLSRPKFSGLNRWRGIMSSSVPLIVLIPILMLQPDFGTSLLLCLVVFTMLFVSGLSTRYVVASIGAGILAIGIAIWQAPYRMARIASFLDPWQSVKTGGFQIIQSYLGFYNGGMTGLGIGRSRQKLFFLPEAHTDFILSVIGEELGFLGVALVIGLFAFLVYLGLVITYRQHEIFQKLLAFGLTCLIAFQASINMGVAVGLLPTKGMPLPFISYGASSLLVFLWVVAILARLNTDTGKTHEIHKT